MKNVAHKASIQVWVCVNERESGARLPSCTRARGDAVLASLRSALTPVLQERGLSVWMNRTLCQGFCHQEGVTVTIEPLGMKLQAVRESDVAALVEHVRQTLDGAHAGRSDPSV